MARVLFVDSHVAEVVKLWRQTGCAGQHQLVVPRRFRSLLNTMDDINRHHPDIVVTDFAFVGSAETGADLIHAFEGLKDRPFFVANAGRGPGDFMLAGVDPDGIADRVPSRLRQLVDIMSELSELGRTGRGPIFNPQLVIA